MFGNQNQGRLLHGCRCQEPRNSFPPFINLNLFQGRHHEHSIDTNIRDDWNPCHPTAVCSSDFELRRHAAFAFQDLSALIQQT